MDGKDVIEKGAYIAKIRAAVAARNDPDFVIIARTDARAVTDFDDAIDRANAALQAGADMAFVEAVQTREELADVPRRVDGPCLLNVVPGGKTPKIGVPDAQALGYKLAIFPGILLASTIVAADSALQSLKEDGLPAPIPLAGNVMEAFRRFGADEWNDLRQKFADEK